MTFDEKTLAELEPILEAFSEKELLRFCEGMLKIAGLGQRVLLARFPETWKKFDDDVEAGRIKL